MPIYDWNGSASTEIGKVYDWDGSASHQIGKVYDNDGTASSLIYSAEETITLSTSSAKGTAWQTVWQNRAVSGYSSVTITITVGGTQDVFFGGISTQQASGDVGVSAPSGALYNIKSTNGGSAGTHTKTLSLDASATYYLYCAVYTGNTTNNGSIKVTAVFS